MQYCDTCPLKDNCGRKPVKRKEEAVVPLSSRYILESEKLQGNAFSFFPSSDPFFFAASEYVNETVLLAHIALFFFVFYPFEITFHFVPYFQDQGIGIIPVLSDIPAFPG